jgi:uncharacterized membrane protein
MSPLTSFVSPALPRSRHVRRLLGASALVVLAALATGGALFGALGGCESDTGCKDDFDCKGAEVCKVSTGVCEAFVCADDLDCDNGLSCNDNACE